MAVLVSGLRGLYVQKLVEKESRLENDYVKILNRNLEEKVVHSLDWAQVKSNKSVVSIIVNVSVSVDTFCLSSFIALFT